MSRLPITVLVPLSRPERVSEVVALFTAQRYPDKRLWFVENGRALGHYERQPYQADRVLTSAASVSAARNVAIEARREAGGGYFAFWDDDDYYGPDYLTDVAADAERASVTGKQTHFVSYDDAQMFFFFRQYANRFTRSAQGGTLSGWSEEALPFAPLRRGEDLEWCTRMRKAGARIWSRGLYHYLYRINSAPSHQHVTGQQSLSYLLYRMGKGHYVGPVDTDIVDGRVGVPAGKPVMAHHPFAP